MSVHRVDAQRDANEKDIVLAFRQLAWQAVRHTAWDLDVLCPRCKKVTPVEVKMPGKNLNKNQAEIAEKGWPLQLVRSIQDVADLVADHIVNECPSS